MCQPQAAAAGIRAHSAAGPLTRRPSPLRRGTRREQQTVALGNKVRRSTLLTISSCACAHCTAAPAAARRGGASPGTPPGTPRQHIEQGKHNQTPGQCVQKIDPCNTPCGVPASASCALIGSNNLIEGTAQQKKAHDKPISCNQHPKHPQHQHGKCSSKQGSGALQTTYLATKCAQQHTCLASRRPPILIQAAARWVTLGGRKTVTADAGVAC